MIIILHTLSPVHVGNGLEISPMEYAVDGGYFYRADMNGIFHDKELFKREDFLAFIEDTTHIPTTPYLGNFDKVIVKKHSRYKLEDTGKIKEEHPAQIKEFIKTENNFYIPGSSIKGAILSALYWYLLKKATNEDPVINEVVRACLTKNFHSLQEIGRDKGYDQIIVTRWNRRFRSSEIDFGGTLQNLVFERLIEERESGAYLRRWLDKKTGKVKVNNDLKFAPWLRVTDTDILSEDDANIGLCNVYGSRNAVGIFYELLKPGVSSYFDMSLQKTVFDLNKILEIADAFYSKVLEANKKWASKNAVSINFDSIEHQQYKLRLGQGSSSFATSLLILAEELNIKNEYLRKWRVTKYQTEPKTSKFVFQGDRPKYPLGWVKLEAKNE